MYVWESSQTPFLGYNIGNEDFKRVGPVEGVVDLRDLEDELEDFLYPVSDLSYVSTSQGPRLRRSWVGPVGVSSNSTFK